MSKFLMTMLLAGALLAQDEVAVPDTSNGPEDLLFKSGDVAPSWALMYAPGKFEFLKNWTVEKDGRLRKFNSQPDRHVVVMSFFATWCEPCKKELPILQKLYEKYENEKIRFFLVDITEATRGNDGFEDSPEAGPWLSERDISMPLLFDHRGVTKEKYGVATLPRLFIIDKYQIIREVRKGFHEGEEEAFFKELSGVIDELLTEE